MGIVPRGLIGKSGVRNYGDSWLAWWVVPLDYDVAGFCDENRAYYGGPGQPYARKPVVRVGRTFILITQSGGFDI